MLERYAAVIDAAGLCPHMRSGGLGRVVIALDRELDRDRTVTAIRATAAPVVHLVFPLVTATAAAFERFSSEVATMVRARGSVHAAFHPSLAGGPEDAGRRIGMVRRAPDPFIQLVPARLPEIARSPLARGGFDLDMIVAELAALHAARRALELASP